MVIKDISALPKGVFVEDAIIESIRQQVRAHGTLKELMIFGHGESERQYVDADSGISAIKNLYLARKAKETGMREDASVNIHTDSFLEKLQALQKEIGVKITDRVVFMGCNVLTNLSATQVENYRQAAKNLGTEIVGPVNTIGITGGGPIGRMLNSNPEVTAQFKKFTPQGNVVTDPLTKLPRSIGDKIVERITNGISGILGASLAWAQCHENKSQAEGAQCQQNQQSHTFPWSNTKPGIALPSPTLNLGQTAAKPVKPTLISK